MAKTQKQITGKKGEDFSCNYLLKNGYEILERNYRHKRAEIDIIAKKDHLLVFIEVKTRKNNHYGNPEDFVDAKKEELFFEASEEYIFQRNWGKDIRFDIIAITFNNNLPELEHLKDVFY